MDTIPTFFLSFSKVHPSSRSVWNYTPGDIRGPGTIGLSPGTRELLQEHVLLGLKERTQRPHLHLKDTQWYA